MWMYTAVGSNDIARAKRFYDAALAPLGVSACFVGEHDVAYSPSGQPVYRTGPTLWILSPFDGQPATRGNGSLQAFLAISQQQVHDFHAAALGNGGTCDGPPGYRTQYAPDFYAAYVRDPDGNKLAAVWRDPARQTS